MDLLGVLYMIKNLLISNEGLNNSKLHKLSRGIATGAIIVSLTMIPGCSFSADALTNPNDVVESYSDKTCFDELLDRHVGTKINMDLLEEYLNASAPGREAACRAVFGTWGFFRTMHGKTAPSC